MTRRKSIRRASWGVRSGRRLRAILMLIAAAVLIWQGWEQKQFFLPADRDVSDKDVTIVQRVVDGDTLVLSSKERLRLIGANTPETVKANWPVEPWGPEASAFTENFVREGTVRLEFDGPRRDKYQRLLAYVWVGDRMLNEELLRAGLAKYESKYPYSSAMKSRFRKAQEEAQAARRGLWSGKDQ